MTGAALAIGLTAVAVPAMPQWYIVLAAISVAWVGINALRREA